MWSNDYVYYLILSTTVDFYVRISKVALLTQQYFLWTSNVEIKEVGIRLHSVFQK